VSGGGGLLGWAVNAVIERSAAARASIRHIAVVVAEQSRAAYATTGVSVLVFVDEALSIFPFTHVLFLLCFGFGFTHERPPWWGGWTCTSGGGVPSALRVLGQATRK
jgi:hypothetical protein